MPVNFLGFLIDDYFFTAPFHGKEVVSSLTRLEA